MSFILFTILSVPVLGGARNLREAKLWALSLGRSQPSTLNAALLPLQVAVALSPQLCT